VASFWAGVMFSLVVWKQYNVFLRMRLEIDLLGGICFPVSVRLVQRSVINNNNIFVVKKKVFIKSMRPFASTFCSLSNVNLLSKF
jgi:hypothetical protein